MKKYVLFALIALFCVSSSAWADTAYVKLTYGNAVSQIEIKLTIDGESIEIYKDNWVSVIDENTTGSINLNEVWSDSDGDSFLCILPLGSITPSFYHDEALSLVRVIYKPYGYRPLPQGKREGHIIETTCFLFDLSL